MKILLVRILGIILNIVLAPFAVFCLIDRFFGAGAAMRCLEEWHIPLTYEQVVLITVCILVVAVSVHLWYQKLIR